MSEDTTRLDWAEQNPEKFLALLSGNDSDDLGLKVYATFTGRTLPSGALEVGKARWNIRAAIDEAIKRDVE